MSKRKTKSKVINKDKLLQKLDIATPEGVALDVIQHYILNPAHTYKYEHLTYVDEVVLLCLLKDVDVLYSTDDYEYYIDGEVVSTSIDKLIEQGYVNSETLKPNKIVLRRVYKNHPFALPANKMSNQNSINTFLDYYVVTDFEQARSKWKSTSFVTTIYNAMRLDRFKNERISFTTFVNIIANKPRLFPPKNKVEQYQRFDHNVSRLNQITSILLKEIQDLL